MTNNNLNEKDIPNALLITRSFPPDYSSAVHRIVKFTKYLPEMGWLPVILTTRLYTRIQDEKALKEIPQTVRIYRVRDPNIGKWRISLRKIVERARTHINFKIKKDFHKGMENKVASSGGLYGKISVWFFIPDESIIWVPFAVLKGLNIIRKHEIKVIYSTSPGVASHFVGYILKKVTKKPWIAEFRDPWSQNAFYYRPTKFHKLIDVYQERAVLNYADKLITVTEEIKDELLRIHPKVTKTKFYVLPNGYDPDDFKEVIPLGINKKYFTMIYVGNLYGSRSISFFSKALEDILTVKKDLRKKIRVFLIGAPIQVVSKSLKDFKLIQKNITIFEHVSHKEAIGYMMGADVLLLVTGKSKATIPAKLYEYLASGKPILTLADAGGAQANLIESLKAGIVVEREDVDTIKTVLLRMYNEWEQGGLSKYMIGSSIRKKYSRKNQTRKLAQIFKEVGSLRKN